MLSRTTPAVMHCNGATARPGEAVAAGAGGLVHVRVAASGEMDAARPVKEGLSAEQQAALLAACAAQPVAHTVTQPVLPLRLMVCNRPFWLTISCDPVHKGFFLVR